jgi:hypothetical protein
MRRNRATLIITAASVQSAEMIVMIIEIEMEHM